MGTVEKRFSTRPPRSLVRLPNCTMTFRDGRAIADRVRWAEERARLQHNLISLKEALEDLETRATANKAAASVRLQDSRDDRDRFSREASFLRDAVDSLRVELAEALAVAAQTNSDGSLSGKGCQAEAFSSLESAAAAESEGPPETSGDGVGDAQSAGQSDGPGHPDEVDAKEREACEAEDVRPRAAETEIGEENAAERKRPEAELVEGSSAKADARLDIRAGKARGDTAADVPGRDRWPDDGYDGSIGKF